MPEPVRGWLILLCRLLIVFHPLSLAVTAVGALNAVAVRGTSVVLILVLRLVVVGFGMAAGRALQTLQPGAVTLGRLALVASAAKEALRVSDLPAHAATAALCGRITRPPSLTSSGRGSRTDD